MKYNLFNLAAQFNFGLFKRIVRSRKLKHQPIFQNCHHFSCYGGRNRKVSEAFVKTGKTLDVLEAEMLGGQKLQGPMTAKEVHISNRKN